MTKQELEAMIDVVIARAPKLREAGVLELGAIGLKLAPLEPEPADTGETAEERAAREEEELRANAWTDPDTFGRRRGVPGRDPRRKEDSR